MKKEMCALLIGVMLILTACSSTKTQIANPASEFCVKQGGTVEIVTAEDGSQSGNCKLKGGVVCDEWAYFRRECPAKKQNAISEFCSSYFDGCNNCFVSAGIIQGCTKKYCEIMEEPKCLEYKIPKNCTSWYDGCNNCGAKDGNLTFCTLMYCENPAEPKCLQYN